jgi:peptide/nickel transport system permease protein
MLTFVVFYLLPSADPALLRAGRQPNPQLVEQIRHNLGLDKPFYTQYWHYMERLVFHWDFGYSYQNNIQVKRQIFDRLPASVSVAVGAAVVWPFAGAPSSIARPWAERSSASPRRPTGSAWSSSTSSRTTSA